LLTLPATANPPAAAAGSCAMVTNSSAGIATLDEIKQVRQNAVKLRSSYSPPGS
jgi:hypothetical protein